MIGCCSRFESSAPTMEEVNKDDRIRKLEYRVEALRNRIDELKRKRIKLRNENAHYILQLHRYKGMLSQPKLNDEEKKQLRVLQNKLDACSDNNKELKKELARVKLLI